MPSIILFKSQRHTITVWLCIVHIALFNTNNVVESAVKNRNYYEYKINPDCKEPQCTLDDPNKAAVNLVSIESTMSNSESKTNFLWSNIGGPPMLITAVTNRSSNLVVDWPRLLPTSKPTNETNDGRAIRFSQPQSDTIGILFERLFIFNDSDKSGVFTKDKECFDLQWSDLVWDSMRRLIYQKDDFLRATLRLKANQRYNHGTIVVKLALPNNAERQKQVPHLKLSQQSISIVLIVDGIQAPVEYKYPRLGATFVVMVQSRSGSVDLEKVSESAISDEYTPGVFRIKSLQFKEKDHSADTTKSNDNLGFLYWKEVAYTDPRKIISRTVDVFDSEYSNTTSTLPDISPPFYEFFRDIKGASNSNSNNKSDDQVHYNLYRYQIIYGKGDNLYSPTNFTDFSFVFGLGAAPEEQMFSFLVKLVIFICFCLPILVMTLGLVFLMMKRWRETGDTELLLAAE